jgi:hypothetical protein
MIQVKATQYANTSEMRAAYAERWIRLRGKRGNTIILTITPPAPPPLWKTESVSFSAHVDDWYRHNIEFGTRPAAYMRKRAPELGVTYDLIIANSRCKKSVWQARQQLIVEVRENFPRLSLPQLGRLFHRDHSTILYTLRKMEAAKAAAE